MIFGNRHAKQTTKPKNEYASTVSHKPYCILNSLNLLLLRLYAVKHFYNVWAFPNYKANNDGN